MLKSSFVWDMTPHNWNTGGRRLGSNILRRITVFVTCNNSVRSCGKRQDSHLRIR
jgi:hypothetical protein